VSTSPCLGFSLISSQIATRPLPLPAHNRRSACGLCAEHSSLEGDAREEGRGIVYRVPLDTIDYLFSVRSRTSFAILRLLKSRRVARRSMHHARYEWARTRLADQGLTSVLINLQSTFYSTLTLLAIPIEVLMQYMFSHEQACNTGKRCKSKSSDECCSQRLHVEIQDLVPIPPLG
jgi:hypothetical protein